MALIWESFVVAAVVTVFFLKIELLIYVYVPAWTSVTFVCGNLVRPGDTRSPGATGTSPDVDAGGQTQVLYKSCSLLSHLPSPSLLFLILDIELFCLLFWFFCCFSTTEILLVEDQYRDFSS